MRCKSLVCVASVITSLSRGMRGGLERELLHRRSANMIQALWRGSLARVAAEARARRQLITFIDDSHPSGKLLRWFRNPRLSEASASKPRRSVFESGGGSVPPFSPAALWTVERRLRRRNFCLTSAPFLLGSSETHRLASPVSSYTCLLLTPIFWRWLVHPTGLKCYPVITLFLPCSAQSVLAVSRKTQDVRKFVQRWVSYF
jgi:hypothetical protein